MNFNLIINYLSSHSFQHYNETSTYTEYKSQLAKDKLLEFVQGFNKEVFSEKYSLSVEDSIGDVQNFSMPQEEQELSGDIETFNDEIECIIKIKKETLVPQYLKEKYNVIIYSSQTNLMKDIRELSLIELEKFLFKDLKKHVLIYILNDIAEKTYCSNGWITLTSDLSDVEKSFSTDIKLELLKIKDRNENLHWISETPSVTPDTFYFQYDDSGIIDELVNKFNSCFITICMGFLAAYTECNYDSEIYHVTFKGQRHVKFGVTYSGHFDNLDSLYHLYRWLYSERTTDKLALTQNVIGFYINKKESPNLDFLIKEILDISLAIKENYKVYIDESMDKYLNERKQLEDFMRHTSTEIEKQVSTITGLMTSNMLGILAAGITAVIVFTQRSSNLLILSIVLYIYAGLVMLLTIYHYAYARKNIKIKEKYYNKRIEDYKRIFFEERIKEIVGDNVEDQLVIFKQYSVVTWIINSVISMAALLIGIYFQTDINVIERMLTFFSNVFKALQLLFT